MHFDSTTAAAPPTPPTDLAWYKTLNGYQASWRRAIIKAIEYGVPTPAFSTALSFYDGYRTARLPANLLQAQRDFFGAHTYERIDKPGVFHTEWIESDSKPVEKAAEPKEPPRRHAAE